MKVVVRFASSAFKHGITRADIYHALGNAEYDDVLDDDSEKHLVLGFDSKAKLLEILYNVSLFQNPVGFETSSWKSGQMSAFPCKSKVACQAKLGFPKTEVLEQPHVIDEQAVKVFHAMPCRHAFRALLDR